MKKVNSVYKIKNECPVCGGDRDKDKDGLYKLMKRSGFIRRVINAGGARIYFHKGSIQVGENCNACDEKQIVEFLNPNGG